MRCWSTILFATAGCVLLADAAPAQQVRQAERLRGGNENPPVITDGLGRFRAELLPDRISFRLRYDIATELSDVQQAHLHVANPGNNGGIVVFLCSNLGNSPDGVTARDCPLSPGVVEGDIVATDVLADAEGSVVAGDLDGLVRLIKQGAIYANVHSDDHPAGEIRGQMSPRTR